MTTNTANFYIPTHVKSEIIESIKSLQMAKNEYPQELQNSQLLYSKDKYLTDLDILTNTIIDLENALTDLNSFHNYMINEQNFIYDNLLIHFLDVIELNEIINKAIDKEYTTAQVKKVLTDYNCNLELFIKVAEYKKLTI